MPKEKTYLGNYIEILLEHETAGDPVSGLKWTRKTTQKIADELKRFGNSVCANTVGRLYAVTVVILVG